MESPLLSDKLLGRQIDRDLSWVASVHRNTGRTHVHVLVAGEGATASAGGARRVVRFGPRDLKALRERIALDAARPIRSAAQVQARTTARAAQDAQRAALYERLGVPLVEVVTQSPTTPAVSADTAEAHAVPLAPPSQAGRKRHWWQRGAGG